jgi:DNA ligase-1
MAINTYLLVSLFYLFHFSLIAQNIPIQHAVTMRESIKVNNYWVSEKLDGIRGYWNGKQLYTRNGNLIKTPKWFTKGWPNTPFEGELWSKRSEFESISSCVLRHKIIDNCWQNLRLMIFDLPNHEGNFTDRIIAMRKLIQDAHSPYLRMIKQIKFASSNELYKHLDFIVINNGEGLMLHHKDSLYKQGRNKQLMKLKKYQDAEAVVIKHISGKGKYTNMLGSLLVETKDGIQFKIGSGFSDEQRKYPPPINSTVTYRYIGKTKRGVPRFASFMRIRK